MWCAFLEPLQQVQDLLLHGHVEGRGRLVGDQQAWLARQRDGDRHPLAHAAGQLVGVLLEPPFGLGDAHLVHQVERPVEASLAGQPEVVPHRLGELGADRA